jgi:hypothetical protein
MKTKILTTALSLIFTNLSLQAAGLINGDFETPNLGGGTGANYPFYNPAPAGFGWTIPSGDIDHIGSHWQAAKTLPSQVLAYGQSPLAWRLTPLLEGTVR